MVQSVAFSSTNPSILSPLLTPSLPPHYSHFFSSLFPCFGGRGKPWVAIYALVLILGYSVFAVLVEQHTQTSSECFEVLPVPLLKTVAGGTPRMLSFLRLLWRHLPKRLQDKRPSGALLN